MIQLLSGWDTKILKKLRKDKPANAGLSSKGGYKMATRQFTIEEAKKRKWKAYSFKITQSTKNVVLYSLLRVKK